MKIKSYLSLLAILILLSSCEIFSKTTAPKNLKNKVVTYYSTKAGPDDKDLLHHNVTYNFSSDSTYTSTFKGSDSENGNYSYVLLNSKTGRLVLSYLWKNDQEPLTYELEMDFETPLKGTWASTYSGDSLGTEQGTFTVNP